MTRCNVTEIRMTLARLAKRLRRRPYKTGTYRRDWTGPRTAASHHASIIGRRVLVTMLGSSGTPLYQRITSGTDPTDAESVAEYIAAHPTAVVEYV